MVAASRSGSTSAVMRLSSPIASTFAIHSSRALELGLLIRPGFASAVAGRLSGETGTLISMDASSHAAAAVASRIIVWPGELIDSDFPPAKPGGERAARHYRAGSV